MDQVLVNLTRNYVGQAASSLGFSLGIESMERISASVMITATQGIVKAFKDCAERGQRAEPNVAI
jgi:hypothetical protein